MRKSTNFNLNLVEGSDLVNPLVQDVPNYETIDEQMYKNECNSIGIATELKSGTVHALTRTIPNASMFRFQATSNFTAGDTFTVDGIQVSALTPSGETLASGAYIIGSEVLCSLRETLLTIYTSGGIVETASDSERLGGQLPSYYGTAEEVNQAITTAQASNVVALSLQTRVDELSLSISDIGTTNYLGVFSKNGVRSFTPNDKAKRLNVSLTYQNQKIAYDTIEVLLAPYKDGVMNLVQFQSTSMGNNFENLISFSYSNGTFTILDDRTSNANIYAHIYEEF